MKLIRCAVIFALLTLPASAQTPIQARVQVDSFGTAAHGQVLKALPGSLVRLSVNIGATAGYVLLYDATAVPSDGSVSPRWCETVVGNGTLGTAVLDFKTPLAFPSNGIAAVFSTTGCGTQTGSNATFYAQVQ